MNTEPYFDGLSYVALDGNTFPDYWGAKSYNDSLVNNSYSAYYQPVEQVLGNNKPGTVDPSGGWDWLTPVIGGVVDAASQIAATKIGTNIQLAKIEAQNRLGLAQQDSALRLAAASNKVPAQPAESSLPGWLLPVGLALGAVLLAR